MLVLHIPILYFQSKLFYKDIETVKTRAMSIVEWFFFNYTSRSCLREQFNMKRVYGDVRYLLDYNLKS